MNADTQSEIPGGADVLAGRIDASCRVPLLALFGGAAFWLVAGLALSLAAIMTFHQPDMFADCPFLTYGRAQAAANDLLLYGFCIPAGLGVMLWIFARLSQAELCLPLASVAAANFWHLGVLIGTVAILIGDSTGFAWLEFPRGASVLLFAAFLLIAISAFATFGARKERELYPSHWFLLAALLWFPWIYSTANLLLTTHHPVRGVAQAVIDWWFSNNLVFVWLALVGVGTAFYFLPNLAGRPLHSRFLALFAFCTLLLFGTWCGIVAGRTRAGVDACCERRWHDVAGRADAGHRNRRLPDGVGFRGLALGQHGVLLHRVQHGFVHVVGLDGHRDGVPANERCDRIHLVRSGASATPNSWLFLHGRVWRDLPLAAASDGF